MSMTQTEESNGAPGAPEWMITYTDIMSLLTTFFILLLTFSTLEDDDFTAARGALRRALGVAGDSKRFKRTAIAPRRILRAGRTSAFGMETPPEWDPLLWESEVQRWDFIKENKLGEIVRIGYLKEKIAIIIKSDELFYPRSDQLKPKSFNTLDRIAFIIRHLPYTIIVRGYDDDLHTSYSGTGFQPVRSHKQDAYATGYRAVRSEYPVQHQGMRTWKNPSTLSIRRAANVAAYLAEKGGVEPFRLAVAGNVSSSLPVQERQRGAKKYAPPPKWERGIAITILPERFEPIKHVK